MDRAARGHAGLELPFAWLRYKIGLFIWTPAILIFTNNATATVWIIFILSFFGIIRALISLVWPVGAAWWFRNREGGRDPSGPEKVSYTDALAELMSYQGDVRPPRHWFVVDRPEPGAAVCGDTLMLTRGLLTSPHLTAVLAHELGHLNTIDGNLTCALNRVILKEPNRNPELEAQYPPGAFTLLWRAVMWFLRGGIGIKLTGPSWAAWWREREYAADKYARDLAYGDDFADYLEEYGLFYDRPVPFVWLTLQTHPPVELRIDRLRGPLDGPLAGMSQEELDEMDAEILRREENQRAAEPDRQHDPEAAPQASADLKDSAS